jgi:hypothetical protein
MALFGSGMPYGMFGGGGMPPGREIGWADKIGALLQDLGAQYDGRQGQAIPMLAYQQQRLGDQKKYQDTLAQLSAPAGTSVTRPTLSAPTSNIPGSLPVVEDPGSINQTPAGPLAGSQFAQMLPLLQNMDPERGMPLAFSMLQDANKTKEPIKLGKDDRLFDPNDLSKPLVGAAPDKINYNQPFMPDGTPNTAYQEYTNRNARASAPNISMSTERSYAGTVAGELAKADAGVLDAARSAPQRIQSAEAVLKILETQAPITGTGANARLALDKALATAGIVDGKSVVSTENLASELASQTLDAIKSSGLGSGQGFTDKDRQFLEKARAGNIELNAGTLHYLARKNAESARQAIRRGNVIAKRLKGDKNFGSVGQELEIAEPPAYGSDNVDNLVNKYLGAGK